METLYIKNMVCDRCISSVESILESENIRYHSVKLGEVHLEKVLSAPQLERLCLRLVDQGFEVIDSTTPVIINKIKSALIDLYNKKDIPDGFKLSSFLTSLFPYDYSHLSRVFSQNEHDTIEHYVIKLRIEKAKELLAYNDLNVGEVAYSLGYSSNAHFSRQFKKLVGVTPSRFQINPKDRKSLEDI